MNVPETKTEIRLKHPKTCNHCPALFATYRGMQCCSLGYKTELDTETRVWTHFTAWDDLIVEIRPAEPCPKPKNINECVNIRKAIDIHRHSNPNSPEYKAENYQQMTKEESLKHYCNLKEI